VRAVAIERYGGPDEQPEPDAGEIVVRVDAAGVGLWDAKVRRGEAGRGDAVPLVLGWEAGGWVHRLGPGVTEFTVGDPVMTYAFRRGPYAEFVATAVDQSARAPTAVDAGSAPALPFPGSPRIRRSPRTSTCAPGILGATSFGTPKTPPARSLRGHFRIAQASLTVRPHSRSSTTRISRLSWSLYCTSMFTPASAMRRAIWPSWPGSSCRRRWTSTSR
jgi:alcohol dehydrogenase-like protein